MADPTWTFAGVAIDSSLTQYFVWGDGTAYSFSSWDYRARIFGEDSTPLDLAGQSPRTIVPFPTAAPPGGLAAELVLIEGRGTTLWLAIGFPALWVYPITALAKEFCQFDGPVRTVYASPSWKTGEQINWPISGPTTPMAPQE